MKRAKDLPISYRLRRSRRWQELTQHEVGQRIGVKNQAISSIENRRSAVDKAYNRLESVVQALGGRIDIWLPGEAAADGEGGGDE